MDNRVACVATATLIKYYLLSAIFESFIFSAPWCSAASRLYLFNWGRIGGVDVYICTDTWSSVGKRIYCFKSGSPLSFACGSFSETSESEVQTRELRLASIPGFHHFLLVHFIVFLYIPHISVLLPKVKIKHSKEWVIIPNRNSSVNTVSNRTGWATEESGFDSRWGKRDFTLLHNVQTCYRAHAASYVMVSGSCLPGSKTVGTRSLQQVRG